MSTAKEHYDKHLGAIYSWMAGDVNIVLDHNRSFFRQLLSCVPRGLALDLGCGAGFQSIPLAEFGFSVLAVDSCASLLSELRSGANNLPIQTIHDDILNFSKCNSERVQLVTCMGDTITHLDSLDAVQTLIEEVSHQLVEGGMLILTFRDYVSSELRGQERFIPVRSDDTRILTCFLEYHPGFVEVHDLLYQKERAQWMLTASSYRKLRLDKNLVIKQMSELGLDIIWDKFDSGMVSLVAKKMGSTS